MKNEKSLLQALKHGSAHPAPPICIPVGRPVEALLRPVITAPGRINPVDVRYLTEWRNQFVESFLTEFEATEQRTSRWLSDIVHHDEGKILFMVDDVFGNPFGYMGLAFVNWSEKYGEADSVVRGKQARSGLMMLALQSLLDWAKGYLNLSSFGVRVRSDNTALEFYRKVGFIEFLRVPLCRKEEDGMIRYVEDQAHKSATVSLVHMAYNPSKTRGKGENHY